MKKIALALILALSTVTAANADIILSTSSTDANAGSDLTLQEGESGSMYVWVSTNDAQVINGLALDILSSVSEVLQATAHNIENPNSRWFAFNGGELGDLVDDSNALTLIGGGLGTNGLDDFVLHSEVVFDATGLGVTELSLAAGAQGISAVGEGDISDTINFGGGTVAVAAVPEPSSIAVLAGVALAFGGYRLRRRRQLKK